MFGETIFGFLFSICLGILLLVALGVGGWLLLRFIMDMMIDIGSALNNPDRRRDDEEVL